MSVEGIILHHGEAGGVTLHQTRVDYLVTAEHSKQCSVFEFSIAPGFNTGAHYHTKIEELFYVLEGELDLRCGERVVHGGPGTFVFVPPGVAHAFGNSGSAPGRMLLITAPPGHEKYFDELRDLIAEGGRPDPEALAKLRAKIRHGSARHADTELNASERVRRRLDQVCCGVLRARAIPRCWAARSGVLQPSISR